MEYLVNPGVGEQAMQGSRLRAASVIAAGAALCFWVLAVLSAYGVFNPHGTAIAVGAGTTASIVAVLCGLTRHRVEQDQRRARLIANQELLIKTLADAVPPRPLARTVPLPRAL